MNLLRTTFLHTKLLNTPFREENISRNELSLSLSLSLFSFQFFRSSTMAIFTRVYIYLSIIDTIPLRLAELLANRDDKLQEEKRLERHEIGRMTAMTGASLARS